MLLSAGHVTLTCTSSESSEGRYIAGAGCKDMGGALCLESAGHEAACSSACVTSSFNQIYIELQFCCCRALRHIPWLLERLAGLERAWFLRMFSLGWYTCLQHSAGHLVA